MEMTRHKFLSILGGAASYVASGECIRSLNSGRQQAMITASKAERIWTWREMFFNLALQTWDERVVFPPEVNKIGRGYWLTSGNAIKDVCFLAENLSLQNNTVAYGSNGISTIRLPNVSTITYPSAMMNGQVADFYIPKVKEFGQNQYTFYGFPTLAVHIAESTCAQILAFKNFPGCQASKYPDITFHGSDGTVYWDGNQWVTKADGAEPPYPYEEDICPMFSSDPADEYWRDMFFKFTEDTWGTTAVFPAEVNTIKRNLWLASSTLVEVTFLCESFTFDHNSAAGANSKLRVVNMPNTVMYDWCSPTQNGSCTELHIPKCKTFKSNMSFDTKQTRMDVYIDESTCDQIRSFKNFPGCIAAQMSKIVFHGSDGTLAYNGSEWVFTAN